MTARQAANREGRSWVHDLFTSRNRLTHAGWEDMSDADARWALDTVISHLEPVDAQAVEPLWALAHAVRYPRPGHSLPRDRSRRQEHLAGGAPLRLSGTRPGNVWFCPLPDLTP